MLRGRRLTVHLMVQPDVAGIMLNDRLLADQGLLSETVRRALTWHSGRAGPAGGRQVERVGASVLEPVIAGPRVMDRVRRSRRAGHRAKW